MRREWRWSFRNPRSSSIRRAGYVLVVDAAKKVELRRVTTGVEQGRDIVVTAGLKEGELVIVEGVQKVRPGSSRCCERPVRRN